MNTDEALDELLAIARQIGAGVVPPYQHMEAFTVGAFDMVLTKVHDGDAFELLTVACGRYSAVKNDADLLRGYLYLILELAQQTNTTELPAGILEIVQEIPESTRQLREWYRIRQTT